MRETRHPSVRSRTLPRLVGLLLLALSAWIGTPAAAQAQVALSPELRQYLAERGPVRMCVDPDWMPFEMIDSKGQHIGMAADYMHLLEGRLGIQIHLVPTTSWSESLDKAKRRDCDILSLLNETPDRSVYLDFTEPYVRAPVVLITNRETDDVQNLDTMAGRTLGLVKGYVYEETIKRDFPAIDYRAIKSIDDGLLTISRGDLTGIVASLYVATHRIQELGIGNLRIASITPYENQLRVGVRNDDPDLVAIFRAAVATLTPEDHIRIRQRWSRIETDPLSGAKTIPLSPDEAAHLKAKGKITMCVDPDWMPYEKIDADGRHVGMAADYIRLIANRIGTPIELVPTKSWSESLKLAKARKCDIMSSLNDTPERRTFLNFTVPYIKSPLVLVTRTDAPFVDGLKDLGERTLSIPAGYAHGEFVRRDYPKISVVDVPTVRDGLEMVSRGEVFAHYGSLYVVVYEIQNAQLSNLKVNGQTEFRNRLSVGVRNDDPVLLGILNHAVGSITPEEHIQIRRKWTSTRFEYAVDYGIVWKVVLGALAVLLVVGAWTWKVSQLNARLQREVEARTRAEARLNRLNEELNRSNAELEQFAYVASHDLQEPLRMVQSYLGLLERRLSGHLTGDTREFMDFALDGAQRMNQMIKDLLLLSRVTTRGHTPEPCDAGACLEAALENLQLAIDEAGAKVSHDSLPVVLADDSQLTRLFQNLVGNAIKYRAEDRAPAIRVEARHDDETGEWVFSVSDNGIGIKEGDLEKVFNIFQRLHGRNEYEGTGIGLAVCKKIVERHKGHIWAESTPETGSTFRFTLPDAKAGD